MLFLFHLFICFISTAGVFCAIVSHPADTVVSKLNNDVGSTPIQAARELGMRGKKRNKHAQVLAAHQSPNLKKMAGIPSMV